MTIADDFSITGVNIRHIAGTTNYTGIEFHRWLASLASDPSYTGDDIMDITLPTPSKRRGTDNYIELVNGYNIDDAASQFLYDASIVQNNGDDIYDSIVNYGTQGIYLEILQNGALLTPNYWGSGINADPAQNISHNFLVKVRSGGVDIDGRRLLGLNREFGYTFGEFAINGTKRGNNTLALKHSADLNNETAEATVAGWTTITATEGYTGIDVDGNGADEFYFVEWTKAAYTINQFYERLKWVQRRGSAETLFGLPGGIFRGITHGITLSARSGTFPAFETVSWTGGTGQMLAIDSATAGTQMWLQLLTGVAPTNGQTITGASTATATADVITDHVISGDLSTGSAIIGSYGLGMTASDLSKNDKLTDLSGTLRIPPNNVSFAMSGLVAGVDEILIGKLSPTYSSTAETLEDMVDVAQLSIAGAHTAGAATVTVQEAIPVDTPSAGTIRIWDGVSFKRVTYTSWSGSIFSGTAGVTTCADGDNIWISYLDKTAAATSESFTGVYAGSDLDLYIRRRANFTEPFETVGALTATGGSVNVQRESDV